MRLVQVAGYVDVGPATGELLQGLARASGDLVALVPVLRHVERMVRDDDLGDRFGKATEHVPHAVDLRLVDAAALEDERSRGAHPHDRELVVDELRLQLRREVALVAPQRGREAHEDVVQRDIMVSRHDYLRLRQRFQPFARGVELPRLGALREVAGNHDEVRIERFDPRAQRREEPFVDRAEVQVGELDDGPQAASRRSLAAGTITASARGRMR